MLHSSRRYVRIITKSIQNTFLTQLQQQSFHSCSSSPLGPLYLPTSPFPRFAISVSVTLGGSLSDSLSWSRSRKVKPPRRLMDENGIKMKAHFQIMKICSRRLGGWGGCRGADQINIEIYVCLAPAQTIPKCYFQWGWGDEVENITKILIAFGMGVRNKGGAAFPADRVHFV